MKRFPVVHCGNEGCTKSWSRDPVLEVECPKCHAPAGVSCGAYRPSEHKLSKAFAGLPPWGHNERDLLAARLGHYGLCPLKKCGTIVDEEAQLAGVPA
jgi:hypothetical protein